VAMAEAQDTPMNGTILANLNSILTIPRPPLFYALRILVRDSF
jgi:hypothetical protein